MNVDDLLNKNSDTEYDPTSKCCVTSCSQTLFNNHPTNQETSVFDTIINISRWFDNANINCLRQEASSEWTRLDEIARKKLCDTIYERLAEMITDGIIQCLFDRTQNEAICSIDTVLRMPYFTSFIQKVRFAHQWVELHGKQEQQAIILSIGAILPSFNNDQTIDDENVKIMTFVQSLLAIMSETWPQISKNLEIHECLDTTQQSKKAIGKTLTINMMRSFTNVVSEHLEQLEKDRPVTAMQATAKY